MTFASTSWAGCAGYSNLQARYHTWIQVEQAADAIKAFDSAQESATHDFLPQLPPTQL